MAARNSVNSRSIVNGRVTYRDIGKKAVRNKHIGKKAVKSANIGRDAVNGYHIKSSSVIGSDIKNGTIRNADISPLANISASKINRTGLDADMVDGKHASAFSELGHLHDALYSSLAHTHDTRYYTEAESNSRFINDGAGEVGSSDIAVNAVDSSKITNGSITNVDIKPNAAIADSKISYSSKTA